MIQTMRASVQPDSTLSLEEDGTRIIFSREEAAGLEETAGAQEISEDPAPSAAESVSAQDRLERKYVCASADVNGFPVSASMLGGEYSMTFHADGTMDFVMVGTAIPGLTWTQDTVETDGGVAKAFIVDYYGTSLVAVCTEEGFDMNYFDSMLMHFVPAK